MSPSTPPDSTRLLAFGAHPDDIEFGCGGILAREAQEGASVHLVICSRGEAGTNGTPEIRGREAQAAADVLGATLEFVDLGGDGHLEHRPLHAIVLAGLIRRIRPHVLLAPTPTENQHPDHVAVAKLVRDAARLARFGGLHELRDQAAHAIGQLFYYAITADAEMKDQQGIIVDVSGAETVQRWTRAMEAHVSQLKTRNYVELQLTRARLLGLRSAVEHAMTLYPNDPLVFHSLRGACGGARHF